MRYIFQQKKLLLKASVDETHAYLWLVSGWKVVLHNYKLNSQRGQTKVVMQIKASSSTVALCSLKIPLMGLIDLSLLL